MFIVLIIAAICYLTYVTWYIIVDARTTLGLTRANVPGIENLLVVSGRPDTHGDSLLTPAQVHLCLRVAELADSLERTKAKKQRRVQMFASLLNEHVTSKATYTWARATLERAISKPLNHSDSVNATMLHIMRPRLTVVKRVYAKHLDTLILASSINK